MNKFISFFIFFSLFIDSNEISFNEIKNLDKESIEVSFLLEKVSLIKSYSLKDPSRIVLDVYETDLKEEIIKKYNYPIKQVRACLLYTSPSPRDATLSRMPSSA